MISFQSIVRDEKNGHCNIEVLLDGNVYNLLMETHYRVAFIPGGDFFFYDGTTDRLIRPNRGNLRVLGARSTLNDIAEKVKEAIFAYDKKQANTLKTQRAN